LREWLDDHQIGAGFTQQLDAARSDTINGGASAGANSLAGGGRT